MLKNFFLPLDTNTHQVMPITSVIQLSLLTIIKHFVLNVMLTCIDSA